MQQVTGRLTQDAIVKTLDSGKEVVNFSIADNESYKPKGSDEVKQFTTFFNCSYWLGTAVAQVLRKGAVVQLNGRMKARPYKTNTGDLAAVLEFNTSRIEVLAYAQKAKGEDTPSVPPAPNGNNGETKDDLPF